MKVNRWWFKIESFRCRLVFRGGICIVLREGRGIYIFIDFFWIFKMIKYFRKERRYEIR